MGKPVVNEHQPSITEWFAAIGEAGASEAFRAEDNGKAERLELLYQTIGLPYERPQRFAARDLVRQSQEFSEVLKQRGNELCAIRLVPKREGLPKLRNRGLTVRECYETWFRQQAINPDDYDAYVCPHSDALEWSAIFVINADVIFGEIIRGLAMQLTHGETASPLYQFRYNFRDWSWSATDPTAARQAKRMVTMLQLPSQAEQQALAKNVNATFSHGYLAGYFETTVWPGDTLYFIDYNRILPRYLPAPPPLTVQPTAAVHGRSAFSGVARGRVVIVYEGNLDTVDFPDGAILVCDNTDIRYLPYMRRAAAIVTNRGGILSHAAIIARELKKPCIIGAQNATQVLKGGDRVEVDATMGIIRKL